MWLELWPYEKTPTQDLLVNLHDEVMQQNNNLEHYLIELKKISVDMIFDLPSGDRFAIDSKHGTLIYYRKDHKSKDKFIPETWTISIWFITSKSIKSISHQKDWWLIESFGPSATLERYDLVRIFQQLQKNQPYNRRIIGSNKSHFLNLLVEKKH